MRKDETLRRMRLGDHYKYLRKRYGHELPDDDAGRADLYELLLPISLGDGADRKMANAIELWAPWMSADERLPLLDQINRTPDYLRKAKAGTLGQKWNLRNCEREAWGIRTVAPIDMTPKQLEAQRKAKKRARDERRRRKADKQPREAYLAAHSISRDKPWLKEGISRAQWYRKQKTRHETGQRQIKLTNSKRSLVSLSKGRGLRGTFETARARRQERTTRRRVLANDLRPRLVSNA